MVLLDERRDTLGSVLGQSLLHFGYKVTGDPLPPVIRVDCQPVDISPPAVKGPDDRSNQLVCRLSNQNSHGSELQGMPEIVRGVSYAWGSTRPPPQCENILDVLGPTSTYRKPPVIYQSLLLLIRDK
jgi:hypothetical protein